MSTTTIWDTPEYERYNKLSLKANSIYIQAREALDNKDANTMANIEGNLMETAYKLLLFSKGKTAWAKNYKKLSDNLYALQKEFRDKFH
jgi:hypothetical protein